MKKGLKEGLLLTSVLLLAACGNVNETSQNTSQDDKQEQQLESKESKKEESKESKKEESKESKKEESKESKEEESKESKKEESKEEESDTVTDGFEPDKYEVGLNDYEQYIEDSESLQELLGDDYLKTDYDATEEIKEYNGKSLTEHLEELNYEVSYASAKQISDDSYLFKGLTEEEQELYLMMVYTQSNIITSAGTQILGQTVENNEAITTLYKELDDELGIKIEKLDELVEIVTVEEETEESKAVMESEAYNKFMNSYLVDNYTLDISGLTTQQEVDDAYKEHLDEVKNKEFVETINGTELNYIHDMVNFLRLSRVVINTSKADEMSDEELEEFFKKRAEKEQAEMESLLEESEGATEESNTEESSTEDTESNE